MSGCAGKVRQQQGPSGRVVTGEEVGVDGQVTGTGGKGVIAGQLRDGGNV